MDFDLNDPGGFTPPKGTILVIDDEPAIQSTICDILFPEYTVVSAGDAQSGMTKIKSSKPDLLLLDLMMPGLNGYEAVRLLYADEQTRLLPIIIITARDFHDSTVDLLRREPNVKGFLHKPFRAKTLREIVQATLNPKK